MRHLTDSSLISRRACLPGSQQRYNEGRSRGLADKGSMVVVAPSW